MALQIVGAPWCVCLALSGFVEEFSPGLDPELQDLADAHYNLKSNIVTKLHLAVGALELLVVLMTQRTVGVIAHRHAYKE